MERDCTVYLSIVESGVKGPDLSFEAPRQSASDHKQILKVRDQWQ